MKVKTSDVGKVRIAVLSGTVGWGPELDELRDFVTRLLTEGHRSIVLDLSGVRVMDSGGVGALATCATRAADKKARISLVIPPNSPIPMVVRSCLILMYPTFPTEKEAIGSLAK
jgi:anti-anti-sigma factor